MKEETILLTLQKSKNLKGNTVTNGVPTQQITWLKWTNTQEPQTTENDSRRN